jgi:hypothetical protein
MKWLPGKRHQPIKPSRGEGSLDRNPSRGRRNVASSAGFTPALIKSPLSCNVCSIWISAFNSEPYFMETDLDPEDLYESSARGCPICYTIVNLDIIAGYKHLIGVKGRKNIKVTVKQYAGVNLESGEITTKIQTFHVLIGSHSADLYCTPGGFRNECRARKSHAKSNLYRVTLPLGYPSCTTRTNILFRDR